MLLSGAWGKVIHEKNQKQKISWHCPFKHRGVKLTVLICAPRQNEEVLLWSKARKEFIENRKIG